MATRLIPELRGLINQVRLIEINLPTLHYRRKRCVSIQVFTVIFKIDDTDMNVFFTFAEKSQLKGHNRKLNNPLANKSVKLNSFPMKHFLVWNSLSQDNVNFKTVTEYKKTLDKL